MFLQFSVQGVPVERGSAQFGFDGAGELKFNKNCLIGLKSRQCSVSLVPDLASEL